MNERIILTALALLLAACGAETETTTDTPPAESAPTEAAPVEAAPVEQQPAPSAPSGDSVTVAALREGFAADQDAWMGTTRTVTGLYMNATSMGGQLNNITMVASRDAAFNETVMCAFGDDGPESVDLTQYDEVTVRGRVDSFFDRPSLRDCSIVTE